MTPAPAAFTAAGDAGQVRWQPAEVTSPRLDHPVPVIAARDIPYISHANRLQNLSIYLPQTPETAGLAGTPVTSLPGADAPARLPRYLVHVHGGAWRDPRLTCASIEPAVACAFSGAGLAPVAAIASLNYTASRSATRPRRSWRIPPSPTTPSRTTTPTWLARPSTRSTSATRCTAWPCSAPSAYQRVLRPVRPQRRRLPGAPVRPAAPGHYGLGYLPEPPYPAALLGLNGLYDLPALATSDGLGASHAHLRDDYERLLSGAFGTDQDAWPAVSPASFDPADIAARIREGNAPRLVVLDQSTEDQLVPMNQKDRLTAALAKIPGLRVAQGHRLTGKHAAPWEEGITIHQSLLDTLQLLREDR